MKKIDLSTILVDDKNTIYSLKDLATLFEVTPSWLCIRLSRGEFANIRMGRGEYKMPSQKQIDRLYELANLYKY